MDLYEIIISEVQKRPSLWNLKEKAYHNRIVVDKDWTKVAEITGLTVRAAKRKWKNLRDHFRKELQRQHNSHSGEEAGQQFSKWSHFESMLFLKNVLKLRRWEASRPVVTEYRPEVNYAETEVLASDTASVENDDIDNFRSTRERNEDKSIKEKEQTSKAAQPQAPTFSEIKLLKDRTTKCAREAKDSNRSETVSTIENQLLKMDSEKLSQQQASEDDDLNFLKSLLPFMKSLPPIRKLMIRSQFQNLLVQEMSNLQNNPSTLHTSCDSGTQLSPTSFSSSIQDQF